MNSKIYLQFLFLSNIVTSLLINPCFDSADSRRVQYNFASVWLLHQNMQVSLYLPTNQKGGAEWTYFYVLYSLLFKNRISQYFGVSVTQAQWNKAEKGKATEKREGSRICPGKTNKGRIGLNTNYYTYF